MSASSGKPRMIPLEDWVPDDPEEFVVKLKLSKTLGAEYLTTLVLPDFAALLHKHQRPAKVVEHPSMVVVLDCSGSMGDSVRVLTQQILPGMLNRLGLLDGMDFYLITFSSETKYRTLSMTVGQLRKNEHKIVAGGTTHMAPVAGCITKILHVLASQNQKVCRILLISDGELNDTPKCLAECAAMTKDVPPGLTLHCQGVRLFTSTKQPDTRGLAAFMQLNNYRKAGIVDLDARTPIHQLKEEFKAFFHNDGLDYSARLRFSSPLAKYEPWGCFVPNIIVSPGPNAFWLQSVPRSVSLETAYGIPFQVVCEVDEAESPDPLAVYDTLKPTLENYLERCKVLKVVGTAESQMQVGQILSYTQALQEFLDNAVTSAHHGEVLSGGVLARYDYVQGLVQKRKISLLHAIREVANDDRISRLSLAQQADYLREVSTDKLGKALARRAEKFGLDFSGTILQELRSMKEHLNELDGVDDSDHIRSFYSQETTVEGIRAVCSMLDDPRVEEFEVNDFLQVVNIVGVACKGPIGEFPDPMTWRVEAIYPGSFISNSDIMMGFLQSQGQLVLRPPGIPDGEITAAIPVFEDPRVQHFLHNHAPNLLEYCCSFGMRRVITGVARTYMYTLCNGVWGSVQRIASAGVKPSGLEESTLAMLARSYREAAGVFFQHVLPHCLDPLPSSDEQQPRPSFYICNNGLTNMIDPLYLLSQAGSTQHVPDILRAIYAFEVHQKLRKVVREHHADHQYAHHTILRLLRANPAATRPGLTPLFVDDPTSPDFNLFYDIDPVLLADFHSGFRHADMVVYLPLFFARIAAQEPVDCPPLSDQLLHRSLALDPDVTVQQFQAGCVIQALLFPTKSDRVDADNSRMKIGDLNSSSAITALFREHLLAECRKDYEHQRALKAAQEQTTLRDQLIDQLCATPLLKTFVQLLRDGLTVPVAPCSPSASSSDTAAIPRSLHFAFANASSPGLPELKQRLFSPASRFPKKLRKIAVFLLATDSQERPIWNNGNTPKTTAEEIAVLDELFQHCGKSALVYLWTETILPKLKGPQFHRYRIDPNHHGHSNDKPSYFALGFPTLAEMIITISRPEFEEYKRVHVDCCGLNRPPFSRTLPLSHRQRCLIKKGYRTHPDASKS